MIRRRPRIRLAETERELMRAAGAFNARLMDVVRPHVRAGNTTEEIDRIVHEYTLDHGHVPACLGYAGEKFPFPKSCCTSINDVICHGIPGPYELVSGDIINVDLTTIVDGWHGDQSETFIIGEVDKKTSDVVQCAFDCLYLAIEAIEPGCRISNIGFSIVDYVHERYGFGVVEKYVGHGIGLKFHQRPNIPHVPNRQSQQERLHPGMCFTIEPMINGGVAYSTCDSQDGWTVRTSDGEPSAQFEHTILMTEDGPEILTMTENGPRPGFDFWKSKQSN
ncbi:type I methionyl aminopeptidase [bacterium]|nr:type I methionyl aminopeptidase [bacterium]